MAYKASDTVGVHFGPDDPSPDEKRVADAMQSAYDSHVRWGFNVGVGGAEGYVGVSVDMPLEVKDLSRDGKSLGYWHGYLAGLYLTHQDREGDTSLYNLSMHAFRIDEKTVEAFLHSDEEDLTKRPQIVGTVSPLVGSNGTPLSLMDVVAWAAFDDATRSGDKGLADLIVSTVCGARKGQTRRPRKAEVRNRRLVLTNTKAERTMFGAVSPEKYITAESYDGAHEIPLGMGKLKTETTIMLLDDQMDLATIPEERRALSYLTDTQRYWLTQLQSVAADNPELPGIYGSDVLRKAGHKKPLRPEAAETMREAAEALTACSHIHYWADTSGESIGYRDKRVVRSSTDRRLVEGSVTLLEYEDGTADFYVDFEGSAHKAASQAFPLLDYAHDKRELMTLPSSIFAFPFKECGTVTTTHRRMMTHIYRQAASKGLSDTILFSTMFRTLGINDTKDAEYRARKKIGRLLDYWKQTKPKVVRTWGWEKDGRKIVGVTVRLNRRYAEQLEEQQEAEWERQRHAKPSGSK